MRWRTAAGLLLSGWVAAPLAFADVPLDLRATPAAPPVPTAGAPAVPVAATPAQIFIRKLPPETAKAPEPKRFVNDYYVNPRSAQVLDEIRVYGQVEPEDYVRRIPPMQKFRERLERDRPMTPKEKAQMALCIVGLCGIYGPEGIPLEGTAADRSEARLSQSTTQLNGQFRGTLQ